MSDYYHSGRISCWDGKGLHRLQPRGSPTYPGPRRTQTLPGLRESQGSPKGRTSRLTKTRPAPTPTKKPCRPGSLPTQGRKQR